MLSTEQWPAPVGALAAYLANIGEQITEARQVSDRRGSTAWKVATTGNTYALKANTEDDYEGRDKRAELEREERVIAELDRLRAVPVGYLVGAGEFESGRWLAVTWAPGGPMWHTLSPARTDDTPYARHLLLACARSMTAAVASLHGAGWVHADIQPTNMLLTQDGAATLIDYALACGPVADGLPDLETGRTPYRGALTHTTAPEIAAAVLDTVDTVHIAPTPAADVWALGASLFWCWTGHRPVPYRDPEGPRGGKLRDIAEGRTLDFASARPWPFPGFEEIVAGCLHPDPDKRPVSADLLTALKTADR
ncbi:MULTISPECIES: protein kinase [unclassified Streptomyces]|uniref:protein kinase domain-containing protein n=1 Tax=unclassified Streptomyces TaxID=2593676 RepID=UPI00336A2308